MEIGIFFIIVLFLIGFIGSYISGLVGIGGSIIKYPMLLYIPPLLGLSAFSAHEVAGISAIQVFFATIGGVWAYRKGGYLNVQLIAYMGTSILIGSFLGAYASNFFSEDGINMVYAILATLAVIMMAIPKKDNENRTLEQINFNRGLAVAISLIVGIGSGIVGAAGAFIIVPILLVIFKIPTRMTIATSLAITFISSIGSTSGKLFTGQIPLEPAVIMIIASLIAAPLGVRTAKQMNTKWLQIILALLILATALQMWINIIGD